VRCAARCSVRNQIVAQAARRVSGGFTLAGRQEPTLSAEQLTEVLSLIKGADSIELKLSVPETNRRSVVASLAMDVMDAQIRQVLFFDTPDLVLDKHGVVVRARRIQARRGDAVVKLRPVVPESLSPSVRKAPGFGVEVDAMPGGFVCSGRMKAVVEDAVLKEVFARRRPVSAAFTKAQRTLFAQFAPTGLELDDLRPLGPINVLKLKFDPEGFDRRLVAEMWTYPDGARILELSTKCEPAEAFGVAASTKAFLHGHGVDLAGEQRTKTRKALEFFASELVGES
jgi:hypothetical protein